METAPPAPRLSVIVCTYNRASFLPGCLASLRGAGVPDLEIVVVDDGSTDDTRQVIEQLNGPDVRYIYQVNKGLSTARNTGILASTGRYIAYLDSDDFWLPGVAADLVAFLDTHPDVGVVFADAKVGNPDEGYKSWAAWAGRAEFAALPATTDGPFRVFDRTAFYRLLIRRNLVFTGAVLQRRELVIDAGLFDAALNAAGDWELYLRMAARAMFAFHPGELAIYTFHDGQMTKDTDRMVREFCDVRRAHLSRVAVAPPEQAILRKSLKEESVYYAYKAYAREDYPTARERFRQVLRESGWDAKTAAYWLLSALPAPLTRGVRWVGRRLTGRRG
ncbi:glycosyltransferase family 2 protein [Fimbriiglobus ruber]|uniref:Glycosyl transferase, family 2 n=1 Tax=Fimbriiglobus ruber TaxID=1908690 RepID=A0A225D815_9BACT|nr:glycosyltransferase family 2 protein [Fimbriiglobus ruber]OWK37740.1 glycosyl transferase, family 2 [Fimbriiglobus ruber]